MGRKLFCFFTLSVMTFVMLGGCAAMKSGGTSPTKIGPPEVIARDAITGAHAALLSLETGHPECGVLGATSAAGQNTWTSSHGKAKICGVIDQAVGAINLAIDATEAYCSIPSVDIEKCTPPQAGTPAAQQLVGKLQSAVGNLNQIMADVATSTGSTPVAPAMNTTKPN